MPPPKNRPTKIYKSTEPTPIQHHYLKLIWHEGFSLLCFLRLNSKNESRVYILIKEGKKCLVSPVTVQSLINKCLIRNAGKTPQKHSTISIENLVYEAEYVVTNYGAKII